jgi:hypothetical protein
MKHSGVWEALMSSRERPRRPSGTTLKIVRYRRRGLLYSVRRERSACSRGHVCVASREGARLKAKIASREKQKETGKITSSGKGWEGERYTGGRKTKREKTHRGRWRGSRGARQLVFYMSRVDLIFPSILGPRRHPGHGGPGTRSRTRLGPPVLFSAWRYCVSSRRLLISPAGSRSPLLTSFFIVPLSNIAAHYVVIDVFDLFMYFRTGIHNANKEYWLLRSLSSKIVSDFFRFGVLIRDWTGTEP